MTEHPEQDEEFEPEYATDRRTAPQSPYATRDVAVGAVIALVAILFTFVVPLVLA